MIELTKKVPKTLEEAYGVVRKFLNLKRELGLIKSSQRATEFALKKIKKKDKS